MHQDNADIINRGWEAMHDILDKEMPKEKKRRKGFFFLLTGLGSVAVVLLVAFLLTRDSNHGAITKQEPAIVQTSSTDDTTVLNSSANEADNLHSTIETKIEEKEQRQEAGTSSNKIKATHTANTITKPTTIETSDQSREKFDNDLSNLKNTSRKQNTLSIDSEPIKKSNPTEKTIVFNPFPKLTQTITTQQSNTPLRTNEQTITTSNQGLNNKATTQSNPRTTNSDENDSIRNNSDNTVSTHTQQQAVGLQNQETDKGNNIIPDLEPTERHANTTNVDSELISIPTLALSEAFLETAVIPVKMKFPFVMVVKPEAEESRLLLSGFTIGIQGSYLTNDSGYGFEGSVGYAKQLSPSFAIEYRLGYGQLSLGAPASDPDDLSTFDGTDTNMSPPAGPAGAPQGAPQDPAENMDMEFTPEEETIMFDPAELEQLSTSQLSRLHVLSNGIYAHWHVSRKLGISLSSGLDYIHNPSFRSLFIVDNTQLVSELPEAARLQSQVEEVQFSIANDWKFNTGIDFVFRLSPALSLSVGYKHYLSTLVNQEIEKNINQARLGVRYRF